MIVRTLPAQCGAEKPHPQSLVSFVVNDCLAIDAGALGILDPFDQSTVEHVVLTHCHADHIATLPVFVENALHEDRRITLYGSKHTLQALRSHVFNDFVWPDLVEREPLIDMVTLEPEEPAAIGNLTVTPIAVNHTVPTFGYLVSEAGCSVLFTSDTGPTERVWQVAADPPVQGVFTEASFPNEMEAWALKTGHLTPKLLAQGVSKLPPSVEVFCTQIKPHYSEQVVREIADLGLPNLHAAPEEQEFNFVGSPVVELRD